MSKLSVRVIVKLASGIPKVDLFGKADPYCILQIGSGPTVKTRTIKGTLNPVWNECFDLPVSDPSSQLLRVIVRDWDRFSADDTIGEGSAPLALLKAGIENDIWIPINKQGRSTGQVQLGVTPIGFGISAAPAHQTTHVTTTQSYAHNPLQSAHSIAHPPPVHTPSYVPPPNSQVTTTQTYMQPAPSIAHTPSYVPPPVVHTPSYVPPPVAHTPSYVPPVTHTPSYVPPVTHTPSYIPPGSNPYGAPDLAYSNQPYYPPSQSYTVTTTQTSYPAYPPTYPPPY
eukprot:TRINITY_DN2042_c0_g1_i1.p1 TRINITY_DN2042_c0_g1~~TRINITY_DN2042_c0_g1_i1.p1  ORF type:complete len:300 (+),score=60.62 TRINITY_DN2042_c0_g1_i1:52-900(+)